MRITDVRVHLVEAAIPVEARVESGAGLKFARQAVVVELETDEGISGLGPCSFGSATFELGSVKSLIEGPFRAELVGRDAGRIQSIWETLFFGLILRSLGDRGVGMAILSAIDIALWDVKGRALGVPIHELLGGRVRDEVPAYASSVYWSTPEAMVQEARAYIARGYSAVKVKVGQDPKGDGERIRHIREQLGPDVDILVDANLCYDRRSAQSFGLELDELDVVFFEEPLSLHDIKGHRDLATLLSTPIATGENLYGSWDFLPFILEGAADVLQPDCSRCGGISEARRIGELVSAHHLLLAPHTFSDALTLAANLQLACSMTSVFTLEVDETSNELMSGLVEEPIRAVDGFIAAPSKPGLGVELDRDWVEQHPYRGRPAIGLGAQPGLGRLEGSHPESAP